MSPEMASPSAATLAMVDAVNIRVEEVVGARADIR
ncbi:hypothetical protein MCHLDSM_03432 [Mycolicibacterium chlorophenolicum]|nr:hypothetical protein MCHLDSM_03432 [Mycolicibacterium chlorophenolicum]